MHTKFYCRVCGGEIQDILQYQNMPKAAQNFPDKNTLDQDMGVGLNVCQCLLCGLVQLSNAPVSYYKEVIRAVAFSQEMKKFRAKQFNAFVKKHSLMNKRIFEVGCGRGEYLSLMNKFNIDGYGIEYADEAVKYCVDRELKVSKLYIESGEEKIEGGPFDAFFILNFFEHLPDPNTTLKGIYNNLNEGGIGIVEVPNFDMMLKNNLFTEFINDHLFYFTKDTLTSTLERNGFEVLECENVWYDYITSATVKKRRILDLSFFNMHRKKLKQELYDYIAKFGDKNVAIYGAGHQALATIALTELDDKIKYVVDDAPFKQNKYTPATHIPIVSSGHLCIDQIKAVIVMAASYSDEVAKKIKQNYSDNLEVVILRDFGLERYL